MGRWKVWTGISGITGGVKHIHFRSRHDFVGKGPSLPRQMLIISRTNRFRSVQMSVSKLTALQIQETDVFRQELNEEIMRCKDAGNKSIWLTLPFNAFPLGPICQELGFTLHHCKADYVVMTLWLLPDEICTLPKYTSHTVGAAGCVLNARTAEVLVIRDTSRPNIWKLPGGFSEPDEDIQMTAQREVLEETGIQCRFESILAFRQHHKMPSSFDMSDIYVVCRMTPESLEIKACPTEIVECRWWNVTDMLSTAQLLPMMRRLLLMVNHGLKNGFDQLDITAETVDSIWPGKTYQLYHRPFSYVTSSAS